MARHLFPILSELFTFFVLLFILQCIQCADGFQCGEKTIAESNVCDLNKDCDDGSDETFGLCYWKECQTGNRCGYGACFTEDQLCDGRNDCWDGTDEHWQRCNAFSETEVHGNCLERQVQCKESKECVNERDTCDGTKDCSDGSDETPENCLNSICPLHSFRCAYGGCIPKESACDHQIDCADGSDETPSICRKKKGQQPDVLWHVYPRQENVPKPMIEELQRYPSGSTSQNVTKEVFPAPIPKSCRVPPSDDTLYVKTLFNTIPYTKNSTVPHTTAVRLSCVNGYALKGGDVNICVDGSWQGNWPECIRTCQARRITNDETIRASCMYGADAIDCSSKDVKLFVGTVARFTCASGYKQNPPFDWYCNRNGTWESYDKTKGISFKCEPDCGIILPTVRKGPWIVSIFQQSSEEPNEFHFNCFGVILTPRLILTHKDCVPSNGEFVIAEGNQTLDFDESQEHAYNLYHLKDIQRTTKPNRGPLAYLTLVNPLKLSAQVRPVCLSSRSPPPDEYEENDFGDQFATFNSSQNKYYLKSIVDKMGNPINIYKWKRFIQKKITQSRMNNTYH